jgi:hypothetical protein
MRYGDKGSCWSFPYPVSDTLDEEVFAEFALPSALKTFMRLKKVVELAELKQKGEDGVEEW